MGLPGGTNGLSLDTSDALGIKINIHAVVPDLPSISFPIHAV
jgi:hypothetical protein